MLEWSNAKRHSSFYKWFHADRLILLQLKLKCGTENVLQSVSEPEKCEYHIAGETPALCLPLEITIPPKEEL